MYLEKSKKPSNKATLALHLFSKCSFTLICRYNSASTSANELSQQWAVRPSTAHRLEIRRALYLHYSNNKVGVAVCYNSAFSNIVRLKLVLVIQLLMVKFHRLEIRRALYLHYSNNKVGVVGVCKLHFSNFVRLKLALVIQLLMVKFHRLERRY